GRTIRSSIVLPPYRPSRVSETQSAPSDHGANGADHPSTLHASGLVLLVGRPPVTEQPARRDGPDQQQNDRHDDCAQDARATHGEVAVRAGGVREPRAGGGGEAVGDDGQSQEVGDDEDNSLSESKPPKALHRSDAARKSDVVALVWIASLSSPQT